jgi:hypothetical protein
MQNNACPECGAPLAAGQARCWLCQRRHEEPHAANPYAAPRPIAAETPLQFSLASLLLLITFVAVCFGAFWTAPGLGVLLIILGVPALIRTAIATNRRQQAGGPSTFVDKIGVFLVSLLIMSAVWMSSAVAFAVVCTLGVVPIGMMGGDDFTLALAVGVIGGLISAIALATWLLRVTAPTAPRPRMER